MSTTKIELKPIEFQTNELNGYIYRIVETKYGFYIRRAGIAKVLWSHGTLTEIYSSQTGDFVPLMSDAKAGSFASVQSAVEFLEQWYS